MLYLSLLDVLFLFTGVLIGLIIAACASAAGQRARCEDCMIKEIIRNERQREEA